MQVASARDAYLHAEDQRRAQERAAAARAGRPRIGASATWETDWASVAVNKVSTWVANLVQGARENPRGVAAGFGADLADQALMTNPISAPYAAVLQLRALLGGQDDTITGQVTRTMSENLTPAQQQQMQQAILAGGLLTFFTPSGGGKTRLGMKVGSEVQNAGLRAAVRALKELQASGVASAIERRLIVNANATNPMGIVNAPLKVSPEAQTVTIGLAEMIADGRRVEALQAVQWAFEQPGGRHFIQEIHWLATRMLEYAPLRPLAGYDIADNKRILSTVAELTLTFAKKRE